jgi:LysR family transcriptional regulator, transcriptional activator of the cysJI operon
MFDFRLKVFHTVAKRLNFTKAAAELFISQPAVTKHIHELENHFSLKLFERNGTKIKLTAAGETLLQYTDQLFAVYRSLEFEMSDLVKKHTGQLRLGASMSVAPYVLPPILAAFHKKFQDVRVTLINGNTARMEQALLDKEIELGVVEGRSRNPSIRYAEFKKDEIVLIGHADHPLAKRGSLRPEELKQIPLLLREPGSGTLEVIAHALKPFGIWLSQLNVEMQLASAESIKSYLLHSPCLAFLSIHSVSKELQNKEFTVIPVKGLRIERPFFFIQPQGQGEPLAELFIRFARAQ